MSPSKKDQKMEAGNTYIRYCHTCGEKTEQYFNGAITICKGKRHRTEQERIDTSIRNIQIRAHQETEERKRAERLGLKN